MSRTDIIFPTEQSLRDFAVFYHPHDTVVAIFTMKLMEGGLDALNQMLRRWYPINSVIFKSLQVKVRSASAFCQECRESGKDARKTYTQSVTTPI